MIDLTRLISYNRFFSCDLEKLLWLLRHQDEPEIRAFWLGFEFARQGRSLERVIWEIEHNREIYVSGPKTN